jgi:hypothetical protein
MENTTEERLPWHKPEILRLDVTLDTQSGGGSGGDGELGTVFDLLEG